MRRIVIFYASQKELNKNWMYYLSRDVKNQYIQYNRIEKKYYFTYHTSEQIHVEHCTVTYDEQLVKNLKKILKNSYENAKTISKSEKMGEFDETKIYSEIESYIFKCSIDGNEPKSIFHFVANFFYKYAAGHKLINGNKRLTFMFTISILRFFGYHFYYSKGEKKNYSFHQEKIEEFVEKSHNLLGKDREKYIDELANWIKSNCTIALEWR